MSPPVLARAACSGTPRTFPRVLSRRLQNLQGNRSASSTSTSSGSDDATPGRQRPITSTKRKAPRISPASKSQTTRPAESPRPAPGPRLISNPFIPVGLPEMASISAEQSKLSEFEEQRLLFEVLDSIRQLHAAVSQVATTASRLARSPSLDLGEEKASSVETRRKEEEQRVDAAAPAPDRENRRERRAKEQREKAEKLRLEKKRARKAEKESRRQQSAEKVQRAQLEQGDRQPVKEQDQREQEEVSEDEPDEVKQDNEEESEDRKQNNQKQSKKPHQATALPPNPSEVSNPPSRIITPIPQYTLLRRANKSVEPLSEHLQVLASEGHSSFTKISSHITDLIQEEYPPRPNLSMSSNPSLSTPSASHSHETSWRTTLNAHIGPLSHTERTAVLRDLQNAEAAALGLYEQKAQIVRGRVLAMAEKAAPHVVLEVSKMLAKAEAQEKAVRAVLLGGRKERGVKARRRAAAAVAAAREAGWGFEGPNSGEEAKKRKGQKTAAVTGYLRTGGIRVGGRRLRLQS